MSDEMKAADGAPKAIVRSAFEWSSVNADELNASHANQWTRFLDVFTWVFNGWAAKDAGDPKSPWKLTDAGQSLTEEQFNSGVAKADAVTWK